MKTIESPNISIESKTNIKSKYILELTFSYTGEKIKFDMIKYNKHYQKLFSIDIKDYKKLSGKLKVDGIDGYGKEYQLDPYTLIFEGEYKNKKRNGKGKEYINYYGGLEVTCNSYPLYSSDKYNYIGFKGEELKVSFEGEYLNGKRNGKGTEYYYNGKIKFNGKYLNGKKWNGKGYDLNGKNIYDIKNGKGRIKEYFSDGRVKFEGDYNNGEIKGNVKIYNIEYMVIDFWQCEQVENREFYYLQYEGEYKNGKKNGKGKEYNKDNILEFEGEFLNGEKNGKGKIYDDNGKVIFEGEYLNGEENGKGKEYNKEGQLIFEGEYKNGKIWNGQKNEYYYRSGKLKFKGEFLNGKPNEGIRYDNNNKAIYRLINGEIFTIDNQKYNEILIIDEKHISGKMNGKGKEYDDKGQLIFEGEYLNGKKLEGKEYRYDGTLIFEGKYNKGEKWSGKINQYGYNSLVFEGEYLNGKRHKGKEYKDNFSNQLIFEGEYKDGEKWNGTVYDYYSNKNQLKYKGTFLNGKKWDITGYDINNNVIYHLKNGKGIAKEFNIWYDHLEYEGEYLNGEKNGKGKNYDYKGNIIFEGEYKNGKRWNGKLYEFDYKDEKLFKGEYLNGKLI